MEVTGGRGKHRNEVVSHKTQKEERAVVWRDAVKEKRNLQRKTKETNRNRGASEGGLRGGGSGAGEGRQVSCGEAEEKRQRLFREAKRLTREQKGVSRTKESHFVV